MRLYHGTHKRNALAIAVEGLTVGAGGFVSLAVRRDVAVGYASMSGGERNFRAAGSRARHVPLADRCVVVVDVPDGTPLEMRGRGLLPDHERRVAGGVPVEWIVSIEPA